MKKIDPNPQTRIRAIIKRANGAAAVYVDRELYDDVCRAHAISPANAPNGVRLLGMVVKPFEIMRDGPGPR